MSERRARYIIFEGIDGAGKSSRMAALEAALATSHPQLPVTRLFEPTRGPAGAEIRRRAQHGPPMTAAEELALFVKDRRAHVAGALGEALSRSGLVLQDRSYLSTCAYQGARPELGLDLPALLDRNAFAPRPDLVVLLDLPVPAALARVRARGEADAFEESAFLERVRAGFLALADESWLVLDATAAPAELDAAIRRAALDLLE